MLEKHDVTRLVFPLRICAVLSSAVSEAMSELLLQLRSASVSDREKMLRKEDAKGAARAVGASLCNFLQNNVFIHIFIFFYVSFFGDVLDIF